MIGSDRKTKRTNKFERRKIRRCAMLVIAGLILGLNLFHWNAAVLVGNTMPMPFGIGVAVVMSGSMSPALETGDLIIVQEKDYYKVGDIIVFQSESDLIVHRVIAKEGDRVRTRGDANNASDEPIEANMVKGTVVAHIPFLGRVVNVLRIPTVGIVLLIIALLLMEWSFKREKKAEEEELDTVKAEIRELKTELDSVTQGDSGGKTG